MVAKTIVYPGWENYCLVRDEQFDKEIIYLFNIFFTIETDTGCKVFSNDLEIPYGMIGGANIFGDYNQIVCNRNL